MARRRVHLTFPENLVQEPIIFRLATDYDIITNIRRANVEDTFGWVILELEGSEDALARGLEYLEERGVQVNTIAGDVVEG
ncbi:MAG TPA: NIL domain-containing protein [Actinomycetota bacterium]|nr:NIL domain-containing protein [Actinomycetota bacterium]